MMATYQETLALLADCCDYPRLDLAAHLRGWSGFAAQHADDGVNSEVGAAFAALAEWFDEVGPAAAQERYTQLFDLKPVATLNISHHLFGDTYRRGAMLSGLAGELNRRGIAHLHDLPDHLPTVLRLLAVTQDEEDRCLLVHSLLLPALDIILERLEPSPGPYPPMLRALRELLVVEIPVGDFEIPRLQEPLEVLPC